MKNTKYTFISFWNITGDRKGLLLTLCSGVTPGSESGYIWDTKDIIWWAACKTSTSLLYYHSGPQSIAVFVIFKLRVAHLAMLSIYFWL